MSHLAEQEVPCPACKQPVMAEVWSSINVREDPELKDLLLGGEINIVECPACKEPFHVDAFLLYHDPDNEIMAFVFPEESEVARDVLAEKAAADFEATQATLPDEERLTYAPATFKGLNELVAFVERDEEVSLQGEVMEAIARESDLQVLRVRPSEARERGLPRLLPMVAGNLRRREALMAGLRRLREINDRLTVYLEALQRLEANPAVLDDLP